MPTETGHLFLGRIPAQKARPSRLPRRVGATTFITGAAVVIGLSTAPIASAKTWERLTGPSPGTIFVANAGSGGGGTGPGSVTMYRPGASGNARPEAVITVGIDGPQGMAVDPARDLWVTNSTSNTVSEYSHSELSKVAPVPKVTITGFDAPVGVAFDASGDLWVANAGTNMIVELAKAELDRSGDPAPVFMLAQDTCGVAFDSSDDMWAADLAESKIVEFAKAELTEIGPPGCRADYPFERPVRTVPARF